MKSLKRLADFADGADYADEGRRMGWRRKGLTLKHPIERSVLIRRIFNELRVKREEGRILFRG